MNPPPAVIAIWSGPRNLSTALMYSFAQRADCRVMDEPLFGHFLKYTGVWRPSREEVLKTMATNAPKILADFRKPSATPLLMLKNMANHIEGIAPEELLQFKNVILTRHPAKVISSYTRQVEKPAELDLCYYHQLQILNFLKAKNRPVWVLDSDNIIEAPENSLMELCAKLQISFDRQMLQWKAGPRPEDGVWAKYWYHSLHKSTGFESPEEAKNYEVPRHLQSLYERSLNLYQKIKTYEQIQPARSPQ